MNPSNGNNTSISEGSAVTEIRDEEYLGDFFKDDTFVLEELDVYEHLVDEEAANDDIWDIMQIEGAFSDTEDMSGWLIY